MCHSSNLDPRRREMSTVDRSIDHKWLLPRSQDPLNSGGERRSAPQALPSAQLNEEVDQVAMYVQEVRDEPQTTPTPCAKRSTMRPRHLERQGAVLGSSDLKRMCHIIPGCPLPLKAPSSTVRNARRPVIEVALYRATMTAATCKPKHAM